VGETGCPPITTSAPQPAGSWELSDRDAFSGRGVEQRAVASNQHDIGIAHSEGGCEMDRVGTAEPVILSLRSSKASEEVVDLDEVHFLEPGVEFADCMAKVPTAHSAESFGLGEGSARFWVDEPHAHDTIGGVPERRGHLGPELGDEQGHHC